MGGIHPQVLELNIVIKCDDAGIIILLFIYLFTSLQVTNGLKVTNLCVSFQYSCKCYKNKQFLYQTISLLNLYMLTWNDL